MQIKLKKTNQDGITRVETGGSIKEVVINEDLMQSNGESISICYKGKSSSGIVDFTPEELEKIYKTVKNRTHLIKGFKTFKGQKGDAL